MAPEIDPESLTCAEVLEDLSAFLDGELAAERIDAVRAHVACCDRCASFGGRFAKAVEQLRGFGPCPTCPPDVKARLRQRLGLDPADGDPVGGASR
jgi:anti-sigma factor RsiW